MFDINIVIVNYNMKPKIDRCLDSLYRDIDQSGLKANVVIVDNASKDGSQDILPGKYPKIKYLYQNENKGFGAGQNVGLSKYESKYHFVLNPDTYFFPEENTLRKMYDFMEKEPKVGMIGPKLVYPDGSLQYSCFRFQTFLQPLFSRTKLGLSGKGKSYHDYLLMKDFDHEDKRPVDWIMGSAMFIRDTALKQVGMFDDRFFMYYEDSDLCRRFWEAGWSVYYVPEAKIEHSYNRASAKISGILKSILGNKLARVHIASWIKYMWKWKGNYKYYHA